MRPRYCCSADSRMRMQNALLLERAYVKIILAIRCSVILQAILFSVLVRMYSVRIEINDACYFVAILYGLKYRS